MKNFLLDLWHDLRAKRLWPVAVVLLAGLVAVPVVLSKKSEAPDVAPPAPVAADAEAEQPEGPAQLAQVKLEELGQGSGSSLSSFDDPNNPFAPPRKVLDALRREKKRGSGAQADAGGSGSDPGGDASLKGGSLGGGAGDASGGGTATVDTGSVDTGGGDTGGGDTGDTGGTDGGDTGETKTTSYTYVVDLTFQANNHRRTIKGMEKLDILPDAASPLLIFLGVTGNAGNAVFLVDSTLDTAGEGTCKPSNSECAFLYLGPGSEHEFTNDEGDSYTLRVDEIRRVELDKKAKASKKDRKTASAAVGQPAPARRFVPPFLADLVSVSSGGSDDSNSDRDRR